MPKTVVSFTAKLVKFDTDVPFAEVISRLDIALNKEGSGNIMAKLKLVNTQDEFTAVINDTIGDSGFLCVQLIYVHSDQCYMFMATDTSWKSSTTDC